MKYLIILAVFCTCLPSCLLAAVPDARTDIRKDAEIISVKGGNHVRFFNEEQWREALIAQLLTAGDTLKTDEYGKLDVLFIDGTQIKVHSKTTLLIKSVRQAGGETGTVFNLAVGEIWSRAQSTPESLKIETPSATAAIRGTDWDVAVDEQGSSYLIVFKGTVELFNPQGSVSVAAGEQAMAEVGKPPVKMFLVRPRDRVQWTVSYPLRIPQLCKFSSGPLVASDHAESGGRLLHAARLFDQRQYAESLAVLDEILNTAPDNGNALVIKGMILLDQGNSDAAAASFEAALRQASAIVAAYARLGMAGVSIQRSDIGRAEVILDTLRQTDDSAQLGVVLASFLAYRGKFREAVELCEEYAALYPEDERFPALAADFLLTLDEPEKARLLLARALEVHPESASAYSILGRYYYLEGQGGEASEAYRRAIAIDPANADARSELGRLLLEQGHYDEALRLMDEAVVLDPRGSSHLARRGMLMNWIQQVELARRDYAAAMELAPADYQSMDGLGYLALKEGRTDDAISYFEKAGTLEPEYAEPHIFLAIAHYHKGDVARALAQLELAKALDPKDPLPYMVAYIIHQDTYRPFTSIAEATRALQLLPNLKSVNPIEKTNEGVSNLGASLLGLGLTEWATSYAEESFDPFEASGYHFVARKHEDNPMVYVSGSTQGFLMDPLSVGYHPRYQDIVARPHHDLTVDTTLGDQDGAFLREHKITQQGYLRQPFEIKYLLDYESKDYDGYRDNGDFRDDMFTYAFGAKPDYRHGFVLFGAVSDKDSGDPGEEGAAYEANDRNDTSYFDLNGGYNYRLGKNHNLLFNVHYSKTKSRVKNPDPYGLGLSDEQLTFVDFFGLENARLLLESGVYDVTNETFYIGPWPFPVFATDSTGVMEMMVEEGGYGVTPIPGDLPATMDPSDTIKNKGSRTGRSYQLKQLMQPNDNHRLSWGIEYDPNDFSVELISRTSTPNSGAFLIDEYILWAYGEETAELLMPYLQAEEATTRLDQDSKYWTVYLNDRWQVNEALLVDMGLYYEKFSNELNEFERLHPRVGFGWKFHDRHILRGAIQKRVLEAFDVTLAPVTTAGLFFEWTQQYPGTRITDYQVTLESRWSDRLFSSVGYEIRDYTLPDLGFELFPEKNRARIVAAALNAILTDKLGAYARYKYIGSKNRDGLNEGRRSPYTPEHSAAAGLMMVLPRHVSATLSAHYAAGQYDDYANDYRLPKIFTVDFETVWEPLQKHVMVKLDIQNLFDKSYENSRGYPAAGRSAYLTCEYRF